MQRYLTFYETQIVLIALETRLDEVVDAVVDAVMQDSPEPDLLTKTAIITRAEIRRRALDIRASHFVPPGKIVERQIIRACCDEANWLTIVQAKEKAGDINALQLNSYHKVANGMARRMETELKEIRG
ncbi:MAG: hypothetical protein P1U85_19175 [Verrucomicrobiales bacterium]|nr:hypothetical protein [Verrucomicrobiales bacterium]